MRNANVLSYIYIYIYIYIILMFSQYYFGSLVSLIYIFERSFGCSHKLHLFDEEYCKNSNVVKFHFNMK